MNISADNWNSFFEKNLKENFEKETLPNYLIKCRWFGGKAKPIQHVKITDNIPIEANKSPARLLLLEVLYRDGSRDIYLLPVCFGDKAEVNAIAREFPSAVITKTLSNNKEVIIYDGIFSAGLQKHILSIISKESRIKGACGEITGYSGSKLKNLLRKKCPSGSHVLKAEQSNTSVIYGKQLFLKFYRRMEEGINPDFEIVKFLTEKKNFPYVPSFMGAIEYKRQGQEPSAVSLMQGLVPNKSDAWTYMLGAVSSYFETLMKLKNKQAILSELPESLFDVTPSSIPAYLVKLIGKDYLTMAKLLGKRTGQLHLALSGDKTVANFTPEPFTIAYQESVYNSMNNLAGDILGALKDNLKKLPGNAVPDAQEILNSRQKILEFFGNIIKKEFSTMKIRIHGDYHLGQVLFTGKDFIIIDFEGEPARKLSERKLKQCALRDVTGMIRSFHYASYSTFFKYASNDNIAAYLEKWIEPWFYFVGGTFLSSYLRTVGKALFLPESRSDTEILFNIYLLEKSVYELGYELNNRPDWINIPLKGIKYILRNL